MQPRTPRDFTKMLAMPCCVGTVRTNRPCSHLERLLLHSPIMHPQPLGPCLLQRQARGHPGCPATSTPYIWIKGVQARTEFRTASSHPLLPLASSAALPRFRRLPGAIDPSAKAWVRRAYKKVGSLASSDWCFSLIFALWFGRCQFSCILW